MHGILACGMTLVIVAAGIDLAVGSVLGLSAVVFSLLTIQLGWGAPLAVAAVLAIGLLLGAAAGGLISGFGLQPFIVTLAMMVFARGLAKLVSGGQKISQAVLRPDGSGYDSVDLPRVFDLIDSRLLGDAVWVVTLVLVAVAAVSWLILARLRVGRHAYAVGANPEAARLAGVPVGADARLRLRVLRPVRGGRRHLPSRPGAAGRPRDRDGVRAQRDRDGGDRGHQSHGGTGRRRPDPDRHAHDRLPAEDPEPQRGGRGRPAHADRRDHRRRGALPALAARPRNRTYDAVRTAPSPGGS